MKAECSSDPKSFSPDRARTLRPSWRRSTLSPCTSQQHHQGHALKWGGGGVTQELTFEYRLHKCTAACLSLSPSKEASSSTLTFDPSVSSPHLSIILSMAAWISCSPRLRERGGGVNAGWATGNKCSRTTGVQVLTRLCAALSVHLWLETPAAGTDPPVCSQEPGPPSRNL